MRRGPTRDEGERRQDDGKPQGGHWRFEECLKDKEQVKSELRELMEDKLGDVANEKASKAEVTSSFRM